jgi:hypothetical protein
MKTTATKGGEGTVAEEMPQAQELPILSKRSIRRFAETMAARTTSHGAALDPDALADRLWKAGRRCVLCRKPGYMWDLYIPGEGADPVARTGLDKSQARLFAYGLCVKCYEAEDAPARVEEAIADGMLEEANLRAALDAGGVSYANRALSDGTRFIAPAHPYTPMGGGAP